MYLTFYFILQNSNLYFFFFFFFPFKTNTTYLLYNTLIITLPIFPIKLFSCNTIVSFFVENQVGSQP